MKTCPNQPRYSTRQFNNFHAGKMLNPPSLRVNSLMVLKFPQRDTRKNNSHLIVNVFVSKYGTFRRFCLLQYTTTSLGFSTRNTLALKLVYQSKAFFMTWDLFSDRGPVNRWKILLFPRPSTDFIDLHSHKIAFPHREVKFSLITAANFTRY